MFATQEQIETIGKQNMEAALAAAEAQLGALQKLASLKLGLTKAGFEAWADKARAIAVAKDAQELWAIQSSLFQPALQTALDYWRGVHGLATQANIEMLRIAERRFAESNSQLASAAGNESNAAVARAKKAA